jgi:hypothetical protein
LLREINVKEGNERSAWVILKECEKLVGANSPYRRETFVLYANLAKVCQNLKKYKQAALYYEKYLQLRDSVYGQNFISNLVKAEAEHVQKENEAKLESQSQILQLKEATITQKNHLNVAISLVVVVLLLLGLLLLKRNREKRKINHLLELKVQERTKELEVNRNDLLKACKQRDLLIGKTAENIRGSLASIKGICNVGRKQVVDPEVTSFFVEMDASSDALLQILSNLKDYERKL